MALRIETIPCRSDNYAFIVHRPGSDAAAVMDAPEAGPIARALSAGGWRLESILLTHHHHDHVEGVEELRTAFGARVLGAAEDAHRLPPLDEALEDGQEIAVCGARGHVVSVPGHTVGHIAFHLPAAGAAFTGDSLMALGCGRLFEGTPEMMWRSLSRLAALPGETLVCSGHEYTLNNARFALTVDPDNPALISRRERVEAARQAGEATVPSVLSEELVTNPFLRAGDSAIRARLGMVGASDAEVFAEIRRRKDAF